MIIHFYTGPSCSLCDLADELIAQIKRPDLIIQKSNIRDSSELYHLYSARIPVLKRDVDGQELSWPFDLNALKAFINEPLAD